MDAFLNGKLFTRSGNETNSEMLIFSVIGLKNRGARKIEDKIVMFG